MCSSKPKSPTSVDEEPNMIRDVCDVIVDKVKDVEAGSGVETPNKRQLVSEVGRVHVASSIFEKENR
jgi:hypothetical protein